MKVNYILTSQNRKNDKFIDNIFEKLKQSGLAVLPKPFKFRESFPLNKDGKTDLVAMANETEGFIILK